MSARLFAENAAIVASMMVLLWIVSVYRRDASVVDPWWSMGFLLISVRTFFASDATPSQMLLLSLVAAWAVRLWLHLLLRSRGKPEDPRYQKFRQRFGPERYWWVSLFQVFVLQGTLMLVISAPLQVAMISDGPLTWNDWAGAGLVAFGVVFEALADWQLQRFRSDVTRHGSVLDSGLWRYSRHPNYFGEAVLWWGFWLSAIDAPGGKWTLFAPVLMTYLLLKVSGVTMLEAQLQDAKPGYRAYIHDTSAFIPWPKRR